MKKAKKQGRPVTTGAGLSVHLKLRPELLEAIDQWREELTRQEAIRLLIALGLAK